MYNFAIAHVGETFFSDYKSNEVHDAHTDDRNALNFFEKH